MTRCVPPAYVVRHVLPYGLRRVAAVNGVVQRNGDKPCAPVACKHGVQCRRTTRGKEKIVRVGTNKPSGAQRSRGGPAAVRVCPLHLPKTDHSLPWRDLDLRGVVLTFSFTVREFTRVPLRDKRDHTEHDTKSSGVRKRANWTTTTRSEKTFDQRWQSGHPYYAASGLRRLKN